MRVAQCRCVRIESRAGQAPNQPARRRQQCGSDDGSDDLDHVGRRLGRKDVAVGALATEQ